jgi:hypothetical protein
MNHAMRRTAAPILAAMLAFALIAATQAQGALRHFDGVVLSKNSDAKTFRIRTQGGGKVKFRVNGTTVFERVPGGFSGLMPGLRVQVNAKRVNSGWLARKVEKGGGGGGHDGAGHH